MKCGLLGEKLGHSYSPQIHAELADYDYRLYERRPEEVEQFVRYGDWRGMNVTIPYKKTVMQYCSELSDTARKIGAVNTLLKRDDGTIYGDNTDAFGFEILLRSLRFDPAGQKALILGSGGASAMAQAVLGGLGAKVFVISRGGENNYENIKEKHADAALIVNTTPVGMYPKNGISPVDVRMFSSLKAVVDVVYNPARTALMLQAEEMSIPFAGGLIMLVAQAKRSAEIFLGKEIPDSELDRIHRQLSFQMQNLIRIGMPGSGKSTIAKMLAERLSRPCFEADQEIVRAAGMSIPDIFKAEGENGFRMRETEVLRDLGKRSGAVISTGGGCITRRENYPLLHQNGIVIRLRRDIDKLPKEGRPLSLKTDLNKMAEIRNPLYEAFADYTVDNNGSREQTVDCILQHLKMSEKHE